MQKPHSIRGTSSGTVTIAAIMKLSLKYRLDDNFAGNVYYTSMEKSPIYSHLYSW